METRGDEAAMNTEHRRRDRFRRERNIERRWWASSAAVSIRFVGILFCIHRCVLLIAGLIYLWVTPEHFEEWWGYGTFFLIAAVAQMSYVPLLLRWSDQAVLLLGIEGNSGSILLYLMTWVVGIPLFLPEAGEVIGFVDVCATVSEAAIVIAIGTLLL
jgi:hypothetical protein